MYDCELVMNTLEQVKKLVDTIIERTQTIKDVNDFLCSPDGMVLLDAVCMNLIAVGEATKNLDKVSNGTLLPLYPQVQWNARQDSAPLFRGGCRSCTAYGKGGHSLG